MLSCVFIDYFANHSLHGYTKSTQTMERGTWAQIQFLLRQAAEHASVKPI